jgi:hypothetical protein
MNRKVISLPRDLDEEEFGEFADGQHSILPTFRHLRKC